MRIPTPTETASYTGSVMSIAAGLTLSQWGVIIGIVLAVATFVVNRIDARRKARIDAEMIRMAAEWHAAKMKTVERGGCVE